MVVAETLEGLIDQLVWFHYDIPGDVLYLSLEQYRKSPSFGEDTPDDLILFRHAETDEPIGLTIVSWWKRFGQGPLPDSLDEIARAIEPWAAKIPVESLT